MRLSLTRKQLETGPALALLRLLEDITSDGEISEQEAEKLNAWVVENEGIVSIPAIAYLETLLSEILADGKVTSSELRALQIASERVLPIEKREIARAKRLAREEAEKLRAKRRRQEDAQRAREYRQLNQPEEYFDFIVAGVKYEDRPIIIKAYLGIGHTVFLAREPNNSHDPNAVAVRLSNGFDIGYVPREHALRMAPLLDRGCKQLASCKKLLGNLPTPVVVAQIYNPEAVIPGAITGEAVPSKQIPPWRKTSQAARNCPPQHAEAPHRSKWSGCIVVAILMFITILVAVKSC